MPQPQAPTPFQAPVFESIWIENANIGVQETPDGKTILMFMLPNGRRYCIPLDSGGKQAVVRMLGSVPVFGAVDIPRNGAR